MKLNTYWDLTKLYPSFDSEEWAKDRDKVKQLIKDSTAWAEKELKTNDNAADKLKHIIYFDNEITAIIKKMDAYCFLVLATDAKNTQALSERDRMQSIEVDAENLSTIVARFIGGIENLENIINSDETFKEYEYYLIENRRDAKYLLSEEVEPVIANMQMTGAKAWENLRNMLDGTMTVEIEQDGEIKSLPLPVVRNMAYSPDPEVRKKGYEAELAAYPKIELALSNSLNAIKGEGNYLCGLRGYDSLLDRSLKDSRMSKEILDAMLGAMKDFLPKFRKYLKTKAKLLGYEGGLPFYDLFAPIGSGADKEYTYEEAHEFLIDVFNGFSSEMSEFVDYAFKNRWIDALPKEGKGGGAFCANLIMIGESRVLSNFTGSFSDVSTLAHELGHAWHGHCLRHLPIIKTSYPMPLAETASIFNEGLVMEAALKEADDEQKFTLIESELMEATQVIVDIYSRYLFETDVIETRHDHGMSVDEMKEAMIKAQKATYGDGLDENYLHPYMWACKVHYYIPELSFYNWPYAFGLLFAKGLLAESKKKGDEFVGEYKELLAATGSADVADVTMRMGIDATKRSFWEQSLGEISEQIDLFCELANKRME